MPLNYQKFFRQMGIVAVGGSLLLGSAGCSWLGSKETAKSKPAITKKVDKNKPEEKKEDINKKDFETMTENAIQSQDKDVAYVLDIDKNKVNYKDKTIASNLQNGDETNSRVLALFDKETSDKTIHDTTKDNVVAVITDGGPQVTVKGDQFAFGDQNTDLSLASIVDVAPTEKQPDAIVEPPTEPEKPKPPVDPPTNPDKPKPSVEPPTDPKKPNTVA
ncbi:hemagglutinin [Bacillus pseudomycoides]|uniref:hemagglutinin n=1 Tax=Bacillus pseudomycoides TaxID=64104 RepID=UPI000BFE45E6|nr:hemagglutinin [Bacillus pseudomycoides]PHC69960.1 hemagglutinin [Bacillus pseudomycoides]